MTPKRDESSNKVFHLDDIPPLVETGPDDGCCDDEAVADAGGSKDGDSAKNDISCKTIAPSSPFIRQLDESLVKFSSWSSSIYNTDKGMKLLQYSLWFLSRALERFQGRRTSHSKDLAKLSTNISMARYILRFYGFFQTAEAVRTGSWYAGWKDKYIQLLGKIMTWSMMFYYPLEHVAYIGWEAPSLMPSALPLLVGSRSRQSKPWGANFYSALSCQFWAIYTAADLASSILKLKHLISKRHNLMLEINSESKTDKASCYERKEDLTNVNRSIKQNALHCLRCLLFLPSSIHFALPNWDTKPWLRSDTVNGLMFGEALVCMYQALC